LITTVSITTFDAVKCAKNLYHATNFKIWLKKWVCLSRKIYFLIDPNVGIFSMIVP
jgi:hypothetical protein